MSRGGVPGSSAGRAGAIVLAGGRSSRFGRDKLAERVAGRSLLDHAIAAVTEIDADLDVVVVAAPGGERTVPAGARVVRDAAAFGGPLAGLATGLAALDAGVDRAILVGGDMPSLVPAVLRRMLEALDAPSPVGLVVLEGDERRGAAGHDREAGQTGEASLPSRPLPAAVRRGPASEAAERLLSAGERRLRALGGVLDVRVLPRAEWRSLDPAGGSLRDVDLPEDLSHDPRSDGDDRAHVLRAVADHVVALRPGQRVVIAIDGVDGAGKTVFADELAAVIGPRRPVVRATEDDFHRPADERYARGRHDPEGFYRDSYDDDALRDRLVGPFRRGESVVTGVFDHRIDAPRVAAPIHPAPDAVLILDGIFLHRPALADGWDASIFLDVGFDVSIPRGAARGEGDPDPGAPSNRRYVEGQRRYLEDADPRSRATWVIDNTDLDRPIVERGPAA